MDFVVRDVRLEVEQKVFVFGVVLRDFDVAAGEGFDRSPALPFRDDEEVRDAVFVAPQDADALVAAH